MGEVRASNLPYGEKNPLVTCRRRENYGEPMKNIMLPLRQIAEEHENVELVYPVHLSPMAQDKALGKPVLVLRRETERPEAVAAGTVKLAGVVQDDIVTMAGRLICDRAAYEKMAHAVNPYGDGRACERIADAILWHFGRKELPPEDYTGE